MSENGLQFVYSELDAIVIDWCDGVQDNNYFHILLIYSIYRSKICLEFQMTQVAQVAHP